MALDRDFLEQRGFTQKTITLFEHGMGGYVIYTDAEDAIFCFCNRHIPLPSRGDITRYCKLFEKSVKLKPNNDGH